LLFAQNGPLNIWFSTNTPPTLGVTNATLLIAGTNGVSILYTNGTPALVPGSTYYLGVQNTNSVTVNYAIEVDFHLVTSTNSPSGTNAIYISSITFTNGGFLLTWYAPTDDIFQVQWTPSLAPTTWSTFTNIITYSSLTPTNGIGFFEFFDDGSQTGGFGPARFYRLILLNIPGGIPETNTVSSNSISIFAVTVPTNADFATNILISASAPVNLLFDQTAPPTGTNAGDFTLLTNTISGTNILSLSSTPPLVPGQTYFLGVQNTNSFALTFSFEVDFHLLTTANPSSVSISSITYTNNGITNGFLLTWYAPTDDLFQVQYTDVLSPLNWQFFTNFISYASLTPTNGIGFFEFFDDGSQTPPGLPTSRFYQIILVGSNPSTHTNSVSFGSIISTNMGITNGFSLSWSAPTNYLFEVQWTTNLAPIILWHAFPNIVSYSMFVNPTNSLFDFFDDGSEGGLGPVKFYRLLLLP
jgi:hypothetical protein